jgi:hypothetical protein
MSDAYRRHHAIQVILVETPRAGSPKTVRGVKPGRYPSSHREAWRPATGIPAKRGKVEAFKRMLDYFKRQDEVVRSMLHPTPLRP